MSLLDIRKSQRAALDKIEAQLLQIRIDARDVGLDALAERAQAFQYDVAAQLARLAITITGQEREQGIESSVPDVCPRCKGPNDHGDECVAYYATKRRGSANYSADPDGSR